MIASVYPPFEFAPLFGHPRPAFPFSEPGCTLTHLGRGGVWLLLRALGLEGRKIAMPAFHCGSEVEAARLAGLEIEFYRIRPDLEVDLDDMSGVAKRCDALYLISFFGFPMPLDEALATGLPVIEDAAHALFSLDANARPMGSRGAGAIFCPRKSLGVPDGGAFLISDTSIRVAGDEQASPRRLGRSTASLALGRLAASKHRLLSAPATSIVSRASTTARAAAEGEMTEAVIGEWKMTDSDVRNAAARASWLTRRAVERADGSGIRARRRTNYETLAALLSDLVPERFRQLPSGVCPLFLPVMVEERDAVMRELWSAGVRATEIWPVEHPLLDGGRFNELAPLRRGLVALPVHQLVSDIEWLSETAVEILGGGGGR